ncbi:hypothetical protein FO519_003515 [Halicephalobus sp. NKZ332]|nr:hypothetical protein FO519_003515 [Halicephalobus sp. NKZ332]
MWLWTAAFLLFSTWPIECRKLEDAKDLVSSFKSVVDLPLSKDFKKAHRFIAFTTSFMKRTVPFAELFATALKVGLEEDQLEALLTLTNGIDAKEVDKIISSLPRQIRVMSHMGMNVTQSLINTFVHECNALNSPATVAQYLSRLVQQCDKPHLPSIAATQLFNLINTIQFMNYTLMTNEENLFSRRFAVYAFPRLHLSLMATNVAQLNALATCLWNICQEYVTMMCANITFYGEPEKAGIFTSEVGQILEPVYSFVSNWFDALLESTWPITESLLIRNIMQDVSKGTMFPETNETYERILDVVHDKMEMIGHSSYRRQYVATQERVAGSESKDFAFACKPHTCTISSTMNAHCISIRTQTDTNDAYESLQSLIEFRNSSWPTFFSAMDEELYHYTFVEKAIQVLADKYRLNFNQFTNHSSYVLLRQDIYPSGCSNAFAMKYDEDLSNTFLQTLQYHEDGTKFTNCEDWLVILGF